MISIRNVRADGAHKINAKRTRQTRPLEIRVMQFSRRLDTPMQFFFYIMLSFSCAYDTSGTIYRKSCRYEDLFYSWLPNMN
jgi:hypothetical protein